MQDLDPFLRRYRSTRDPDDLAEVFDQSAARLLRLAVHLAGDAAVAEDLVQQTFLAVIERPESFDAGRGAWPWLVGILSNKARLHRRDAARVPDPDRLLERAVSTPLDETLEAELSGDLARAIDELEEPYRRTLLLRLRHGMGPADIAHALGETPGAVRTRLSRGIEKLRARLPRSHASLLLFWSSPERGLGIVRDAVLGRAKEAALAAGTASVSIGSVSIGGLLMTNKVLVTCAALVAAVVLSVLLRDMLAGQEQHAAAPGPDRAGLTAPHAEGAGLAVPLPIEAVETRTAERVVRRDPVVALTGRVFDGTTEEALGGAAIEFYPLHRTTFDELMRETAGERRPTPWDGDFRMTASLPRPVAPITKEQRFELQRLRILTARQDSEPEARRRTLRDEGETFLIHDRPGEHSTPIAFTKSAGDGSYSLDVPEEGGTLVCSLDGYGTRAIPISHAELPHDLPLFEPRLLQGSVIDDMGRPWPRALRILFYDYSASAWEPDLTTGELIPHSQSQTWSVVTDEAGRFTASIPSDRVEALSSTPGVALTSSGIHPENGQTWSFPSEFEPGRIEPVLLVAKLAPALRVTEAETGAPIERFAMTGTSVITGMVATNWSGWHDAPGGIYPLEQRDRDLSVVGGQFELTIWTKDRFARRRIEDLAQEGWIDVPLELRSFGVLTGRVLEDGAPLQGAAVALEPYSGGAWRPSYPRAPIDFVHAASDGSFRLTAPDGEYLLRVEAEDLVHVQPVQLPAPAPLVLDFAGFAELVVEVRDGTGALRAGHGVGLGPPREPVWKTGWYDFLTTGEDGRARFHPLPPGEYELHVSRAPTQESFSGGVLERVSVAAGERTVRTVTVPTSGTPANARIVTDVPVDLSRWRARDRTEDWVAVEPDGTVPIDLQRMNFRNLEIEDGERRLWDVTLPEDAGPGYAIHIALAGIRYEGVLREMGSARLLSGIRVEADPIGSSGATEPSTVTDAEGHFVLICTEPVPHSFSFRPDGGYPWPFPRGLGFVHFQAEATPTLEPRSMTIELPRVSDSNPQELRAWNFRVISSATGAAVSNALVSVSTRFPSELGELLVFAQDRGDGLTDDEGRVRLQAIAAGLSRVTVQFPAGTPKLLDEPLDSFDAGEIVLSVPVK